METIKEIAQILGFILVWLAGVYLWGSVKNRKG